MPDMKPYKNIALLTALLLAAAGWSRSKSDGQLAGDVQSKINSDAVVQSKTVSVGANNGVVTLSGAVASDLERTAAGNDAAQTEGVRTVVNELQVQPAAAASSAPAPAEAAQRTARPRHAAQPSRRQYSA